MSPASSQSPPTSTRWTRRPVELHDVPVLGDCLLRLADQARHVTLRQGRAGAGPPLRWPPSTSRRCSASVRHVVGHSWGTRGRPASGAGVDHAADLRERRTPTSRQTAFARRGLGVRVPSSPPPVTCISGGDEQSADVSARAVESDRCAVGSRARGGGEPSSAGRSPPSVRSPLPQGRLDRLSRTPAAARLIP